MAFFGFSKEPEVLLCGCTLLSDACREWPRLEILCACGVIRSLEKLPPLYLAAGFKPAVCVVKSRLFYSGTGSISAVVIIRVQFDLILRSTVSAYIRSREGTVSCCPDPYPINRCKC